MRSIESFLMPRGLLSFRLDRKKTEFDVRPTDVCSIVEPVDIDFPLRIRRFSITPPMYCSVALPETPGSHLFQVLEFDPLEDPHDPLISFRT